MSARNLKLALGVSVVLNVFLLAGGAAFWWSSQEAAKQAEADRTPPLSVPAVELVNTRSPEVAEKVLTEMRQIAMSAHEDYQEARTARREAIDITASDQFDTARVSGLLEQSRASEMRGRARLESGVVDMLSRLNVEDRKALATLLSRKRPRNGETAHTDHTPDEKVPDPNAKPNT
jgi:uncharacterized membrane protein